VVILSMLWEIARILCLYSLTTLCANFGISLAIVSLQKDKKAETANTTLNTLFLFLKQPHDYREVVLVYTI